MINEKESDLDNSDSLDVNDDNMGNRQSIADNYEYVMYGKLYRVTEGSGGREKAELQISFGGLLMLLKGDHSHFNKFELDQRLYLLMRKV
ncbi:hypothetical protein TSUD_21970 [Trifolium subterraneum]|uniref:Uncharacterized protein n=1 Tax=Trifolium subterraneum TaxID=3900 RepID=A0A2Z6NB18_TRISU|nr:hypothetical protein TSUD_21970 [Trifolium subterraneum]